MGLILVFDLDQTLVNTNGLTKKTVNDLNIKSFLNIRLINEVLKPALNLRNKGVDAIFLLSNNSSKDYVSNVIQALETMLNVTNLFNYSMIRTDPSRPNNENPPKSLKDIKYMMDYAGIKYTDDDLASRVYFFDDYTGHEIRNEIDADNYIVIQGPLDAGKPDLSDYRKITSALNSLKRGGSKTRRVKRKTRKYKSCKSKYR